MGVAITVGAPTIASYTTGQSTALAGNLPASAATGTVLLAQLAMRGATVTAAPSGWTLVASAAATSNAPTIYAYVHPISAIGSEPASYTWTSSTAVNSHVVIIPWEGVDLTTPLAVSTSATASTGAATTVTMGTVTTLTADAMLVGGAAINTSADQAWSGSFGTQTGEVSAQCSGVVGYEADPTAGTSESTSWTWQTNTKSAGWASALRATAAAVTLEGSTAGVAASAGNIVTSGLGGAAAGVSTLTGAAIADRVLAATGPVGQAGLVGTISQTLLLTATSTGLGHPVGNIVPLGPGMIARATGRATVVGKLSGPVDTRSVARLHNMIHLGDIGTQGRPN